MKKIIIIIVALVVLVVLIFVFGASSLNNILKNSTLLNPHDGTYLINGEKITLKNGISEAEAAPGSASKIITRYFGNDVKHDLNDDGRTDSAFIITQETGGSGLFYYVVARLNTKNGPLGSDGVFLGDRISPQSTEIDEGKTTQGTNRQNVIVVNYAVRASGEPFTTPPSIGKTVWLKLDPTAMQLGEVAQNFEGETNSPITYTNAEYGFTFSLPASWKGYSILENEWNGTSDTNKPVTKGTTVVIRHPKWTSSLHHEDIPVMVFTKAQWDSYVAGDFFTSAAPFNASELGRNNSFVFALPPRWDYDYSLGYQEAENIIKSNPLHPYNL